MTLIRSAPDGQKTRLDGTEAYPANDNVTNPGNPDVYINAEAQSRLGSFRVMLASVGAVTNNQIKSTSISGLFDAFFVADGFSGDGYIEWTVKGATSTNYTCGLDPTFTNIDRNSIDYGLACDSAGNLFVKESGVNTAVGTYAVNDVLKIERVGTDIKYYKNAGLLKTTGGAPITLLNIAYNSANTANPPQEILEGLNVSGVQIIGLIDEANVSFIAGGTTSEVDILVGPTKIFSADPLTDPKTASIIWEVDYGSGFSMPGSGSLADLASDITANLLLDSDKARIRNKITKVGGFTDDVVNGFYFNKL